MKKLLNIYSNNSCQIDGSLLAKGVPHEKLGGNFLLNYSVTWTKHSDKEMQPIDYNIRTIWPPITNFAGKSAISSINRSTSLNFISHDESVMMVTSPKFRTLKMLFLIPKLDKMTKELQKWPKNEQEERPVNDGPARGVRIQIVCLKIVPYPCQI